MAERLARLTGQADTLTDMARTFGAERGDAGSEVLAWAEALGATLRSHARDLNDAESACGPRSVR